MSNLVNKIVDAVTPGHTEKTTTTKTTHSSHAPGHAGAGVGTGAGVGSGAGVGTHHTTGGTGYNLPAGTVGPHGKVGNILDPTVDSDASRAHGTGVTGAGVGPGQHAMGTGTNTHHQHSATHGGAVGSAIGGSHTTPGSGHAQQTAGPHNSNLMNKLDPQVDSDLDGSGGRKTFQTIHGETLDAAKHPPSVFAQVHGEPEVKHDSPKRHVRRPSSQDFYGN